MRHNAGPSTGATPTPCADYVAFALDGAVITAPVTTATINGDTQISAAAPRLHRVQRHQPGQPAQVRRAAAELRHRDQHTVSATLGSGQLKAGLLAGGIGLILVVIYSLLYYRALGLVTIASLLVSGALTYGCWSSSAARSASR